MSASSAAKPSRYASQGAMPFSFGVRIISIASPSLPDMHSSAQTRGIEQAMSPFAVVKLKSVRVTLTDVSDTLATVEYGAVRESAKRTFGTQLVIFVAVRTVISSPTASESALTTLTFTYAPSSSPADTGVGSAASTTSAAATVA